MKIAFNPSTVAALTSPPKNKDITFDLRGRNIFARGVEFKGTDTNTWRDIKINNVSIGSNILDLRNGSNTTLTNSKGVVTINSTWRPVVDSLTSDSTTSSLSANQGRVLKSLIDGKSDSGHNHDGRYVRYYAVTALDCNNLAGGLTAARISATNAAHTNHSAYLYISDVGTPFQLQIPDSSAPYIYKRYYGSGKWSGWFKLNAGYADSAGSVDWGNVANKPESFTPSYHTHTWTSITDKIVAGNEFNVVNAGYDQTMWFNYLPINDRDSTAYIHSYHFGNGAKGYAPITASGFIKTGSSSSYVLLGDGGHQAISSLSVNYANSAGSTPNLTIHQYLSNTDTTWWPLIWGGSSHNNTSDSTGAVYKSHDKLSWQTSSQTLYATRFRTTFIDLENNRGISRVTTGGTSPYKGIKLPDLQSNGLGMFSRFSNSTDEGGIIISEDTSVIYNSFDTGWGLSVRDKDLNQTDISNDNTIAFGVRQDHRAYSLGGFEKAGSDNTYVLLGGGGHKLESSLNVANADTLDGHHASSFVRAGFVDNNGANLNSLDTYSFIKSVNSTVTSASPGGYTGWYNVIQAVHRNGAGDGPGYIGQIALGMTTNLSAMFYRIKYNGSWYAWNEVLTTNTGLLRYSRNNVNISSPNCSPIPPSLLEWTVGYPRLYDPEFIDGNNNVNVYNNAGNGVVTVTRVHDTNVGNSSSYVMKVVSASGASPNYGGWNVWTQTELGKVYTCLFRASIPSGVEIEFNTNSIGSGGGAAWLTNHMGTGKWTWYAMQVYCGSGGSTTFFFSAKSPCTWYLSYVNVIENNRASYAGLRSVYSDYLKQNPSLVFGRSELQYFNQYTGVTSGAKNNANPTTDWYHILRMNHANNSGYFVDLAIPFNNNRIQFRRIVSGSDNGWRRVITEEPNHDVILREANTSGNVGIGINNPAYKLDVNGQMRAEGFHHWTVNSDNYMLLAGGGYMIHKTGTTAQSTAIQFGKYVWIMLQIGWATNGLRIVPTNISKPTKDIYVMCAQPGNFSNSRHGKYRVSPDGNLYFVEGVNEMQIYTTICYVASS